LAEPIIVSFSELDTGRQCYLKHRWAYKERWVGRTTSEALAKGTLWHNVMEAHYRTLKKIQDDQANGVEWLGPAIVEELRKATAIWLYDIRSGKQSEHQALIEWMYEGYLKMWGLDPDWRILAVEHAPVVPLRDANGRKTRYHLKLKIDLVVLEQSTNHLLIVDHKSCSNLPNDKMLELNDQFGLYTWALRELGRKVWGSVHSAARTQRNVDDSEKGQPLPTRFRRTPLYRGEAELDRIALEAYEWARDLWTRKTTPRSANEDTCRWRCDYTEACLLSRKGNPERETLLNFGFRQDFTRH
jgi:hypothetical protein